jgi:SAM-dependent methyltransferase
MEPAVRVFECTAFFSFLRIQIGMSDAHGDERILSANLIHTGSHCFAHKQSGEFLVGPNPYPILETLIDRAEFPHNYDVVVLTDKGGHRVNCSDLVDVERRHYAQPSIMPFMTLLEDWRAENPGVTPKVLDIGGRARSGYLLSSDMQDCNVTVLDIRADTGVDVVADAHSMSNQLGVECFDFVICVSVFEHLVMPWKAAIEINKVMKPGGLALIQTHQTVGMHDLPWDYYRYSDESWKGLFNAATGFEIISTAMNDFVRVVPSHYYGASEGYEMSGGFYDSNVMARKVGSTKLAWPVELEAIISTSYPD